MVPRGRPSAPRGVYSFEEPTLVLPGELLLDTSVVVEALVRSQPRRQACRDLFERIADSGSTVFFNRLVEVELAEAAFVLALKERYGARAWRRQRYDGRARRRATRLLDEVLGAWSRLLEGLSWVVVELQEVSAAVPELMGQWGLSSYDAVHVATAVYVDVTDLATLDAGFSVVPADKLTLHVDSSRLRRCRELRR